MAATPEALIKKTRRALDLAGQVFGQLVVEEYLGRTPRNQIVWRALCTCGESVVVKTSDLCSGDTTSCGCLHRALLVKKNKQSTNPWRREHQREYNSYISARRRCLEASDKDYYRYGAVGVTFYAPWAASFRAFCEYMGRRPPGTTLDRIDPAKGYIPGNVRWATPTVQAENRKSTVWVRLHGECMTATEAARRLGVTNGAVYAQLKQKGTLDGYHPRRKSKSADKETADDARNLLCHAGE